MLVMGPWSHGGWARGAGPTLGNLDFAIKTERVLPREHPVPVLHGVPEGQAGEAAGSLDVPDRHQRVQAPGRVAAEGICSRRRCISTPAASCRARARPEPQPFDEYVSDPESARCRTSATSAAG